MPQPQHDIAKRLRTLSAEMSELAVEIDYFGGFAWWARLSGEVAGVSESFQCLADSIESDRTARH